MTTEALRTGIRLTTGGILLAALAVTLPAAERFELKEEPADARVFKVAVALEVAGKVYPEAGADKALKLAVEARFGYDERRLVGTGREAETLRSIRYYDQAAATIHEQSLAVKAAAEQLSRFSLRDSLRLIVAAGKPDGIELFSPSGPLTVGELQLLRYPGDSLAALALLPDSKVEADESWQPPEWVLPMLTGIEAAEKSELTCRLESADAKAARVSFTGEITGIALGVPANVKVSGKYDYDFEQRCLRRMELSQEEKRSIGSVSPGLDVSAKVVMTREVNANPRRLTNKDIAGVALEPNEANRLVTFDAPAWNARFHHDRNWHVRYHTPEVAVLKFLDKGRPIAQCHIKSIPDADRGQHASEDEFKQDVRRTLGKDFQEFVEAETLKLRDDLYVYRVVAVGSLPSRNDKKEPVVVPMQWNYYLVANPEGRQLSFAFAVEPQFSEDFRSRDVSIVGGLEFLPRGPKLTPVKGRAK